MVGIWDGASYLTFYAVLCNICSFAECVGHCDQCSGDEQCQTCELGYTLAETVPCPRESFIKTVIKNNNNNKNNNNLIYAPYNEVKLK